MATQNKQKRTKTKAARNPALVEYGKRVMAARNDREWSQAELAEALDTTQSIISRVEHGDSVGVELMDRIEAELGIEPVAQAKTDRRAAKATKRARKPARRSRGTEATREAGAMRERTRSAQTTRDIDAVTLVRLGGTATGIARHANFEALIKFVEIAETRGVNDALTFLMEHVARQPQLPFEGRATGDEEHVEYDRDVGRRTSPNAMHA